MFNHTLNVHGLVQMHGQLEHHAHNLRPAKS
jgi:hypothetical protein